MRRFIGLDIFRDFYKTPADLLTDEGLSAFLSSLKSEQADSVCAQNHISSEELDLFITSLNNPQNILFYSWVSESEALSTYLKSGELRELDAAKIKKHQFFNEFKTFVTPYLAPKLLAEENEELNHLLNAFSYTLLLDEDHASLVESKLFKPVMESIVFQLRKGELAENEDDLLAIAQTVTSNTIIGIVNSLTRSSYATRLNYVDDVLTIIRMDACSPRLANWLIRQLEQVQLNKEHQHKLYDFRAELKSGVIKTKNSLLKKSPLQFGRITMTLFIILVGLGVWWIVKYKPFSEPEPIPIVDSTSFEQFTPEERQRIDSMLKEMQGNRPSEDYLDNSAPIYGGSSTIVVRNKYPNDKLEKMYDDFVIDVELKNQASDTCGRESKFTPLNGTKSLSARSGNLSAMVKNDSDYDALVIIAQPIKNGTIYSALLKAGTIEVYQFDKGDILTVIYGQKFQVFDPPNGAGQSNLPSNSFSHHFCETDFNYENSINTAYEIVDTNGGKTKILITGDLHSMVDLLDIYGVLEVW